MILPHLPYAPVPTIPTSLGAIPSHVSATHHASHPPSQLLFAPHFSSRHIPSRRPYPERSRDVPRVPQVLLLAIYRHYGYSQSQVAGVSSSIFIATGCLGSIIGSPIGGVAWEKMGGYAGALTVPFYMFVVMFAIAGFVIGKYGNRRSVEEDVPVGSFSLPLNVLPLSSLLRRLVSRSLLISMGRLQPEVGLTSTQLGLDRMRPGVKGVSWPSSVQSRFE
jgi:hypothetical protein